jgi:RNA recognition motif-containing protein
MECQMILISIDNLSSETSEEEVKGLFSRYGKIKSIKLTLGASHSRCGGSGLIEMEGSKVKNIIAALDGRLLWGRFLRVKQVRLIKPTKKGQFTKSDRPDQSSAASATKRAFQPFRVTSVEKIDDPELGPEKDWYRYTIVSGHSKITGLHRGTIAEVREFAVNSVQSFNQRHNLTTSRPFHWSLSHKKS